MTAITTAGRWFNKAAMPLVKKFGRWPASSGGFGMGVVVYRGRRSGRWFSLVVGFRRTGGGAVVKVELPDQKRWWRNFQGQRQPATLEVAGEQYPGQALASRDEHGDVRVHIDFD